MVNQEESNHSQSQLPVSENGEKNDSLFSPRFKSVVAMAGWDEEALLSAAALIVEDTPDRLSKQRKRLDLHNRNSPLTNSRRKRRAQRRSLDTSMPVVVLSLDDDDDDPPAKEENSTTMNKIVQEEEEVKEIGAFDCKTQGSSSVSSLNPVIPCIDRLREELSCAICLEICYEPSTTPCGHSFCKSCLRSAADKCGKRCPKCRQFISNGRSCTVNTVLWNTIQMLFPQEVEARKASIAPYRREAQTQNAARVGQQSLQHVESVEVLLESVSHSSNTNRRSSRHNMRRRSRVQPSDTLIQGEDVVRRTNIIPIQDEDAALALRMQREEFMGVFGHQRSDDAPQSSLALARANLRAMASRATRIRRRDRTT